jgi:PTS system mannose-specific IIB component
MAARVDQKLIHGQVTLAWAPFLGVEEIVVADDLALESQLLMEIMASGVQPPAKKASFVSPVKLAEYLRARLAKPDDPRLLILFRDVTGALEAFSEGLCCASLNLGNHFCLSSQYQALRLADSFFVSPDDFQALTALARQGLDIYFQALPADLPVPFDPGRYRWTL